MFTISSVASTVIKRDYRYAFKIDLQDAYFHVPIHLSSRKYLRFAFENKVYQFRVLPVSRHSVTSGSGESFTPRIQGLGDSSLCMRNILPTSTVVLMSVPIHGFIQLGLEQVSSHWVLSTFTFLSDKLVYTNTSIKPAGPCTLLRQ